MVDSVLISVIMPAYNAEKTISGAISSVLNQSYNNFELIIIDDDSTDSTYFIIKEIAKKDNRIRVLKNNINMGVAACRNVGLKVVKGDYIWFIDADDYADIRLMDNILPYLKSNDIVKFGYFEEYCDENSNILYYKCQTLKPFICRKNIEVLEKAFLLWRTIGLGFLWNSIIKTSIIKDNDIVFDTRLNANEDFDFVFKVVTKAHSMSFVDCCLYHYLKRPSGSITTTKLESYYTDSIIKVEYFSDLLSKYFKDDTDKIHVVLWEYTRIIYSTLERNRDDFDYYYKLIVGSDLFNKVMCKSNNIYGLKENILFNILKIKNRFLVRVFVELIHTTKQHFPIIFAKNKS